MATLINARHAKTYAEAHQTFESVLAKSLYKEFNEGAAKEKLQWLAWHCLYRMAYWGPDQVKIAAGEDGELRVWRHVPGGENAEAIKRFLDMPWYQSIGKFSASDVSDVIRAFGTWVEKGGLANPYLDEKVKLKDKDKETEKGLSDSIKGAYRPGEKVWELPYRDRTKNKKDAWPVEAHVDVREEADKAAVYGMMLKRAKDDSNVLKIDHIFGLITGCDISGTTSDTVFALEVVGYDLFTAAYYLLPMATIVYNNHHSLIEVALALTLNDVIDYEVGFYQTLLPKRCKVPPELQGIGEILRTADGAGTNRHVVCFYKDRDRGGLAGGYLFNREEAEAIMLASQCFNAGDLLKKAPGFKRYPTQKALQEHFGQYLEVTGAGSGTGELMAA